MSKNSKITLCGVVSALCIALMFLNVIIPIMGYTIPAVAGVLLLFVLIETSASWAFMSYVTVSCLSILLLPEKSSALLFILLLGYYPLIKFYIDKCKIKILNLLIKFLIFNATAILYFIIATKILKIPAEEFQAFGISITWLLLLLGNITFFLYDFALKGVALKYMHSLHPKIQKFIK